jgi:uncharacterized protein YegP (UPF0339 family)
MASQKNVIEVYKARNGKFRFRVIGKNGEKIAVSEDYTRRVDAIKTVNLIRGGSFAYNDATARV